MNTAPSAWTLGQDRTTHEPEAPSCTARSQRPRAAGSIAPAGAAWPFLDRDRTRNAKDDERLAPLPAQVERPVQARNARIDIANRFRGHQIQIGAGAREQFALGRDPAVELDEIADAVQQCLAVVCERQAHAGTAQQHHAAPLAGEVGERAGGRDFGDAQAPATGVTVGRYADRLVRDAAAVFPARRGERGSAERSSMLRPPVYRSAAVGEPVFGQRVASGGSTPRFPS